LVFLDTPGYHISEKKLNLRLRGVSDEAFSDADIVLYLIDATRKPGPEEEAVAAALAYASERLVAGINKIDSPDADVETARLFVSAKFPKAPILELSALKSAGLEALLAALYERAKEGPAWYPEEYYTDQEPVFRIAEIIREKIFLHMRDELPHAVYVSYEDSSRGENDSLLASYDLVVERESQKGMLIGKGGSMIKRIREEAEKDLADIFDYAIRLKLSVRVDPDWKKNDKQLEKLIY
jgi:GTP-binding protein Era